MCKVQSPSKCQNIKLWKRNIKPKADDISCEEVLKLIPRDIMMDFNTAKVYLMKEAMMIKVIYHK